MHKKPEYLDKTHSNFTNLCICGVLFILVFGHVTCWLDRLFSDAPSDSSDVMVGDPLLPWSHTFSVNINQCKIKICSNKLLSIKPLLKEPDVSMYTVYFTSVFHTTFRRSIRASDLTKSVILIVMYIPLFSFSLINTLKSPTHWFLWQLLLTEQTTAKTTHSGIKIVWETLSENGSKQSAACCKLWMLIDKKKVFSGSSYTNQLQGKHVALGNET